MEAGLACKRRFRGMRSARLNLVSPGHRTPGRRGRECLAQGGPRAPCTRGGTTSPVTRLAQQDCVLP